VDFDLNWGKMVFLAFSRKEVVLGKTGYSPLSLSLGPIYEQNMGEIDFFHLCHQKSILFNICGKSLLISENTFIEVAKYCVREKAIFPPLRIEYGPSASQFNKRDVQDTKLVLNAKLVIILVTISFHVTSLSIVARSR